MGVWRANMHHGNGKADWAGCLSALGFYGLGGAMSGGGCGCSSFFMWFIILCPIFFIYNLIAGNKMESLFYGFFTAIIVLAFVLIIWDSHQEHEQRGRVTLKFVGIKYRGDEAYQRYLKLKKGEKVLFVKEPDNPKDPKAVKVVTMDGYHIGYVARDDTYYINCYPDNTYVGRFYRYDSEQQDYHYVRFYAKDNGMEY